MTYQDSLDQLAIAIALQDWQGAQLHVEEAIRLAPCSYSRHALADERARILQHLPQPGVMGWLKGVMGR